MDKPRGPTSHDVVARVRRALQTREVGHGGTLDPMATGLLVVLVGTATRLEPYVSVGDKSYEATVRLGVGTDTLDADGEIVARASLPTDVDARLFDALTAERRRTAQVPPAVSAIHVDGARAHERVRRGESFTLAAREIAVRALAHSGVTPGDGWLDVRLTVTASKGYYVRALARDLGESLGLPAHLVSLRRTGSGAFTVGEAVALDGEIAARIVPVRAAVTRLMPTHSLTEEGATRARQGKPLSAEHFTTAPASGPAGWTLGDEVVAIGARDGDVFHVTRGFPWMSSRSNTNQ